MKFQLFTRPLAYLACIFWLPGLIYPLAAHAPSAPAACVLSNRVDEHELACLRRHYTAPIEQWPLATLDPGVQRTELAPLPASAPQPTYNPGTAAKIALGKRLFNDPLLSRSGQIACASCHERELGWADGKSVAHGHDRQQGRRNAPSVAMSAYATSLFWDGRAATLEEQALFPIQDPKEMAFTLPELEARMATLAHYRPLFTAAFGDDAISATRIGHALAAFQRTLVPRGNRLDRFLRGQHAALSDQELWGMHLFRTRARCMNCHGGPALSDNGFHNLGLHLYGHCRQDLGRYEITGDPQDAGKFRTPSLRGVARTGPWLHNGLVPELRGLLNMYNDGMPNPQPPAGENPSPFPAQDPLLKPLDLSAQELAAIQAFLHTL